MYSSVINKERFVRAAQSMLPLDTATRFVTDVKGQWGYLSVIWNLSTKILFLLRPVKPGKSPDIHYLPIRMHTLGKLIDLLKKAATAGLFLVNQVPIKTLCSLVLLLMQSLSWAQFYVENCQDSCFGPGCVSLTLSVCVPAFITMCSGLFSTCLKTDFPSCLPHPPPHLFPLSYCLYLLPILSSGLRKSPRKIEVSVFERSSRKKSGRKISSYSDDIESERDNLIEREILLVGIKLTDLEFSC